jgi:hypothetical protein
MKQSPRVPKSPSNVPDSVHQQLNMYALAASAAGVSLLALAQPAEGRIVYTPANIKITENGGLISFDLNHDGIPDFGLSDKYSFFSTRWLEKCLTRADIVRDAIFRQLRTLLGIIHSFLSQSHSQGQRLV